MTKDKIHRLIEEFDEAERLFAKHERHPDENIFVCVADRMAAADDLVWAIKTGRVRDKELRQMVFERQSLALSRRAAMCCVLPDLVVKRPAEPQHR